MSLKTYCTRLWTGPGVHKSQEPKFCKVAPKIVSIITTVLFSHAKKKCVSSHVWSRKRQIPEMFGGHSIILVSCHLSGTANLEVGPIFLENSIAYIMAYVYHRTNLGDTIVCPKGRCCCSDSDVTGFGMDNRGPVLAEERIYSRVPKIANSDS
jgi:hypothetical protein